MSTRSYPIDAIGNQIRKGDLVRVTLTEAALVFVVADVESAGMLRGPDGAPMALNGTITISVTVPVPFTPGSRMGNMHVLKKPDEDIVAGVAGGPTLVKQ
jgi:hypothetical protein